MLTPISKVSAPSGFGIRMDELMLFIQPPSIHTDVKYETNEAWPLKTDDFFPYADHQMDTGQGILQVDRRSRAMSGS